MIPEIFPFHETGPDFEFEKSLSGGIFPDKGASPFGGKTILLEKFSGKGGMLWINFFKRLTKKP